MCKKTEKKTFKNLTEDEKLMISNAYRDRTNSGLTVEKLATKIGDSFDLSERTVRKWFQKLNLTEKVPIEPEALVIAKKKVHDKTKKRFLITSAQNATPVHQGFLTNLKAYAEFIDAEILVIPYRYHNPTSFLLDSDKRDDWWSSDITEYLTLNRHNLNNGITVLANVKIQPTASSPLNGFEGMTGAHSSVIGHPRLELKVIPVIGDSQPKILFTTGSCTKLNYIDSKAGAKAEWHHSIGFAIVEIKDADTFFFRQVSATKTGEFIDLFNNVKDGVVTREVTVDALIMGDIHVANCDPRVTDITFNDLTKKLYPNKVFIHDIIDSESISHHNLKDPFKLHEQEMDGSNSLAKELDDMIKWLEHVKDYDTYIVKSNHDEHIDGWLRTNNFHKMTTLKNAIPYMEYATLTLKGEAPNGIVPYVINKHYPKMKCLTYEDNVSVNGWICSVHGHLGGNGSRGSLAQYSRLSQKSVTGHSHTIGRIGGAVSVGTSTYLKVGYNKSFSSWVNSHGIINRLKKFQHIIFFHTVDGLEYTTLD